MQLGNGEILEDILTEKDTDHGVYSNSFYKAMKPVPNMTVSEWADKYRMLSRESSPEPGKWYTERTPYLREPMDCINDPAVERIIFMSSAQVGKSEFILNITGYFIHQDPAPILMVQPTIEAARDFSKTRLRPMFRDTEPLKEIVGNFTEKTRNSDNTIRDVLFPGGRLSIVGANSPSQLASKPIRVLLCDEVDRYDDTKEGDPLELASKRTSNFHNRKLVYVSTPTEEGLSRIEYWYKESDERRYFVPCPHCIHYQVLTLDSVKWDKDDEGLHLPETARIVCENCRKDISNGQRIKMLQKGQWRSTSETGGRKGIVGFHINELYSPWSSIERLAANFITAAKRRDQMKLREFFNLSMGEVYKVEAVTVDETSLYKRRESYGEFDCPKQVKILTAGVDVQQDRLECEVVGWGEDNESWGIEYIILFGDTSDQEIYNQLYLRLMEPYQHEDGHDIRVFCTAIDSGDGNYTDEVYKWVRGKSRFRIFAIKGSSVYGKPITSKPSKGNKYGVPLFTVGTDTAKALIYHRLALEIPGSGYMHFPMRYESEYFRQLTAEKQVLKQNKYGFKERKWVVRGGRRNEALDCRVYAMAALSILDVNWKLMSSKKAVSGKYIQLGDMRNKQAGNSKRIRLNDVSKK